MGRAATVLEVASSTSPDKTYRVWVGEDGPIFCNCPGHRYVRADGERRECKHMKAIIGNRDVLMMAAAIAEDGAETVTPRQVHRGIRFIEVQEETTEGVWVTTVNLSRFNNLEV